MKQADDATAALAPGTLMTELESVSPRDLAGVAVLRTIAPNYLTFADYPWLGALLDERQRYVGQRRREWRMRVNEPFSFASPAAKLQVALGVLDRIVKDQSPLVPSPRQLRATVRPDALRRARAPTTAQGECLH